MGRYIIDGRSKEYPWSYKKVVELNLTNFDLWYFLENEQALDRYEGLKKRYPKRDLIPFARRDDCDDLACFEVGKGIKVQIIHDLATSGYEQKKEYDDIWEWIRSAINEMIEYNREEELYQK